MLDKFIKKSPAKINLFLKILNKRQDGFYNIRSGITLISLFDEIYIENNDCFLIRYEGPFAPIDGFFSDCILEKVCSEYEIKKPNLKFTIKKNIPIEAGLGGASSNAATFIKILEDLDLIKKNNDKIQRIGSDVPLFYNNKDCLIRSKGEIIINKTFPKYYFLLVKPNINCSTKTMYQNFINEDLDYDHFFDNETINEYDIGNDFEKVVFRISPEIKNIIYFLSNVENVFYSRMTGSGSCCYAVFNNKTHALIAKDKFNKSFPNLWSYIAENNKSI